MDWWLASFFIGALLSLFLPIVPDFFVLFLLLLLSISFFYYSFKLNNHLRACSGLLFGATWMLFNAFHFQHLWQDNNINAVELSAKTQWLQGQVLSLQLPKKQNELTDRDKKPTNNASEDARLRFDIKVTHLNKQKLNKTIQVRLSWKSATLPLQQGQTAYLKAKLKPAHGLANLGGFSYQTWLNSKGISATGYVVNHKSNKVIIAEPSLRQQLFNDYTELLTKYWPEDELTPLLLALGFGSRSALNQDLWQVLQATGTGHLIAISGLHIGLVATGCYFFIMLFVRLLPLQLFTNSHLLQSLNIRYLAIGLSMLVALNYGYLAGFSLPTIRALVMVSLYWCVRLMAIKVSITRWLLLTLFLLTLTTPFSLFTASFWLSVYAVTVIFLTLWRFRNIIATGHQIWRFIKGLLVIQLSLTLMLLPISAVFFQQVSTVALLANLIAVPWMSFFSIPLCLLSVLLLPISDLISQFFVMLSLESLQLLWYYLTYLSTQSWAVLSLSSRHIQLLVLAGLLSVIFLFFQPRITFVRLGFKAKYVAAVFGGAIVLYSALFSISRNTANSTLVSTQAIPTQKISTPPWNKTINWQLVVFDVGQGLSVLIQHKNRAILYDTGASYPSGFNMIEAAVLPYLQYAGIKKLDKVIISHSDNDHAGGLSTLQQLIPIKDLIYNASTKSAASTCSQGERFDWQGLNISVLWPEKSVAKDNDDSCVLLISDGKHQVLLTGDISVKVEALLMQKYPQLQADVLVVPHHGSKTSSSAAFISQLKPELGIVSAGFLNRWHMPVMDVVNRYQANNVPLLNTAESGQIIVNFSETEITTQTYHDDLWPFWFANSY